MPNKAVNRTQVPVLPKDLSFVASPLLSRSGEYQRHQVQLYYQPVDTQGAPIGPQQEVSPAALNAAALAALAAFVDILVAAANSREGT